MILFNRAIFLILMVVSGLLNRSFAQESPDSIVHTLFLIGDAGEPEVSESPLAKALKGMVKNSSLKPTFLFLGDNIYPSGLSASGTSTFARDQKIIQTQVDWVKELNGKGIIIPGNHDWHHWGKDGLDYVKREQQWIDSLKDENILFFPKGGCAGPVELVLNDDLVLVILDTQWFLHQHEKPEESACDANTTQEVMTLLADVFKRNYNKRIIVAGHHPIITYGSHGGVFGIKDHLFPLTVLRENLYIPFPVIGSFVPLYRKLFGHIQDTSHPVYKEFSLPLQSLLESYPGSIYVAGHEHALQYNYKDSVHYIVSGAAVKTTHTKHKGYSRFAQGVEGFAQLDILRDGTVRLRFVQVDDEFPDGKELYSTKIMASANLRSKADSAPLNFSEVFVKVSASGQYQTSKLGQALFGENYRNEWSEMIEVPVFDIRKLQGGLRILQQGGGQQTLSLRLEDSTGHEYVIRSVEKYPEKAVPEMFRKTFAQDLVQDQISASHPYAALVIPHLAEAVGIYHTNPNLFYVPDDPRLNEYRKLFANTLVLFEERPAGDWSEAKNFGNSKKIVNTAKVIEKLMDDNDNRVDQKFVLKSRLFDFVIGDWDRHDDQWRWATISEKKKGDVFRPIPRDRDQAFFLNEGHLAKVWSRKWALPKFEGFDERIDWPAGLAFNARYFDRTFLTGLSKEDWIDIARQVQINLTDEAIENAIKTWPEKIYQTRGEKIIKALKKRRDHLVEDAVSYYHFLAKEVDVVGSDKRERFNITRLSNGNTQVVVNKITKENEVGRKMYDRVFNADETKEIRIYGLKGEDEFLINGGSKQAIRIRVIGGEGKDSLVDSSRVAVGTKTLFYDLKNDATIASSSDTKQMFSTDPSVNEYDRKAFQYNRLAPLIYVTANPDDGLFTGGGFINIRHGFRKRPFKARHIFLASVAPLTASFNFSYQGKFTEALGKWNLELDADLRSPNYVNNFFGFGNETTFDRDLDDRDDLDVDESIDYYRYRFEEFRFEPTLSRTFGNGLTIKAGPSFQRIEMEDPQADEDRFINDFASSLPYDLFSEYKSFIGGAWSLMADGRNDKMLTRRGALLSVNGRTMSGINNGIAFSSFDGALSFYHSFRSSSRVVFALRAGGGVNTGTYEFYQAQILDGRTELRGYRKTRFYGDKKLYSNAEVRVKLLNIKTYLFPASLGIVGFHDFGRVWYKDSTGRDPSALSGISDVWHQGYGGGVWFTPFSLTVLSGEFARSKDGNMFYIRLGFLF